MDTPETLPQLVTRLRTAKWPSRREADRITGIPYATWQNIEVRGTIPTIETLARVAEALEVPQRVIVNAARVSQAAREPDPPIKILVRNEIIAAHAHPPAPEVPAQPRQYRPSRIFGNAF